MAHLTNFSFEFFLWNFHRRCLSTSSIPWCKKVKNDQKLESRGGGPALSNDLGQFQRNHCLLNGWRYWSAGGIIMCNFVQGCILSSFKLLWTVQWVMYFFPLSNSISINSPPHSPHQHRKTSSLPRLTFRWAQRVHFRPRVRLPILKRVSFESIRSKLVSEMKRQHWKNFHSYIAPALE